MRLKLTIAYDGRPFRGWQSQATRDGVQDFLEKAFAEIVGARVIVHGSGRTDAGVHALAQVAHADVPPERVPLAKWADALNARLPAEIRVMRATRAAHDFHARFDACGKRYRYRIWCGPAFHPLEIGRAWFMPIPLDLPMLRECARLYLGTHNFASFAANRGSPESGTVRTIRDVRVAARGQLLTLHFEGDGFLYKMVRLLTGTLVRVAQHRAPREFIRELLAAPGERKTHFCAPAEGLYLERVYYAKPTRKVTARR
jgi:tRNA pseudouridine38-40 synthase